MLATPAIPDQRTVSVATAGQQVPIVPCVAALLAVAAWCMPNHYDPWLAFHSELVMAVAFALAGVWAQWRMRSASIGAPFLALVAMAACLVPLGQLAAGILVFAGDFWIVALYLLGFALAVTAGYQLALFEGMERLLDFIAWTLLAAALMCVWLALYQWQRLEYLGVFAVAIPPGGRVGANFAQPNHLATLLVLGLCATAWLLQGARIGGAVALLLVLVLGAVLAMTQSRTGWLSATVITGWLMCHRRRLGPGLRPLRLLVGYAVLVTCAVLWTWLLTVGAMPTERSVEAMASQGLRLTHWTSFVDAIGRHPWAGYGWNQVSSAQALVAADHPHTGEILEHSHNLILDLLVWNGLPLGGLLIAALLWWGWRVLRGTREPAAVVAVGALIAIMIHAMLEYAMVYSYFMLPAALLMGAITASTTPRSALCLPRGVQPVLMATALGLTALVVKDYLPLEQNWRVLRYESARIGMHLPQPAFPSVLLLTQLEGMQRFARERHRAGMSAEDLEAMRRVATRYPYDFVRLHYAAAAALNDQPEAARLALLPICKTHPPDSCERARKFWETAGKREARIAAIPWPKSSEQ